MGCSMCAMRCEARRKHAVCRNCRCRFFFQRRWQSRYEARQDGCINVERLRAVFVLALMESKLADAPIWIGLVSRSMERLEAESSRDRGRIYVPNLPHVTTPVSVGWQFSTLMLEPSQPSSWVGILDQRRSGTEQSAIGVGIEQLRAVLPLIKGEGIKREVIVLADRWYAVARFVLACRQLGGQGPHPAQTQPHIVSPRSPAPRQARGVLQPRCAL